MAVKNISDAILKEDYFGFAREVKAPLRKYLPICAKKCNGFLDWIRLICSVWEIVKSVQRYPEPTKENTKKHITHVLLDVWDEFFQYEINIEASSAEGTAPLFRAIRRLSVCECEHDRYYSQRITWFIKRLTEKYLSGEWLPLEPWCPEEHWNDITVMKELVKVRHEFHTKLTINGRPFNEVET